MMGKTNEIIQNGGNALMVSIDEMEVMINEIAKELPQEFFEYLNGGILLLPEAKIHNKSRSNDLYIMGEYHQDRMMGKFIKIYYGSFLRIYKNMNNEQLKDKLEGTIKHEFRHHIETLAGEKDLQIEDSKKILEYLNKNTK